MLSKSSDVSVPSFSIVSKRNRFVISIHLSMFTYLQVFSTLNALNWVVRVPFYLSFVFLDVIQKKKDSIFLV